MELESNVEDITSHQQTIKRKRSDVDSSDAESSDASTIIFEVQPIKKIKRSEVPGVLTDHNNLSFSKQKISQKNISKVLEESSDSNLEDINNSDSDNFDSEQKKGSFKNLSPVKSPTQSISKDMPCEESCSPFKLHLSSSPEISKSPQKNIQGNTPLKSPNKKSASPGKGIVVTKDIEERNHSSDSDAPAATTILKSTKSSDDEDIPLKCLKVKENSPKMQNASQDSDSSDDVPIASLKQKQILDSEYESPETEPYHSDKNFKPFKTSTKYHAPDKEKQQKKVLKKKKAKKTKSDDSDSEDDVPLKVSNPKMTTHSDTTSDTDDEKSSNSNKNQSKKQKPTVKTSTATKKNNSSSSSENSDEDNKSVKAVEIKEGDTKKIKKFESSSEDEEPLSSLKIENAKPLKKSVKNENDSVSSNKKEHSKLKLKNHNKRIEKRNRNNNSEEENPRKEKNIALKRKDSSKDKKPLKLISNIKKDKSFTSNKKSVAVKNLKILETKRNNSESSDSDSNDEKPLKSFKNEKESESSDDDVPLKFNKQEKKNASSSEDDEPLTSFKNEKNKESESSSSDDDAPLKPKSETNKSDGSSTDDDVPLKSVILKSGDKKTKKQNDGNAKNKKQKQGESAGIKRLKKYIALAGFRFTNYTKLLENCKSEAAKKRRLNEFLEEKGMKGKPTIEKCKKLKNKLERKREIAELDLNNIIETEGSRPRRKSGFQLMSSFSPAVPRDDVSSEDDLEKNKVKKVFSRLKALADSDSD